MLGIVKGRGVVMFESNKEGVKVCYKNVFCIISLIDSMWVFLGCRVFIKLVFVIYELLEFLFCNDSFF